MADNGFMVRLEQRIAAWLEQRRRERLTTRFGGIQRCPWCRQCAQDGNGWSFSPWSQNPLHDVLTCGVCGGTSIWHFAMVMVPLCALEPPAPDPQFPTDAAIAQASPS